MLLGEKGAAMRTLSGVTKKVKAEQSAEQLACGRVNSGGSGAGSVSDRARRAAQAVDQDGPGDRAERGDGRGPRLGETRSSRSGDGQHLQRYRGPLGV